MKSRAHIPRLSSLWILLLGGAILASGCHPDRAMRTAPSLSLVPTDGATLNSQALDTDIPADRWESEPLPFKEDFTSALALSGVPTEVRPLRTPWGEPWDHTDLCHNMDRILREHGVESADARVRMIAHAVVASGWRQNVWNFNAWGVRQGSWDAGWYSMSTMEMNSSGEFFTVRDARWRSFNEWAEAINDYRARIAADSPRPSYRKAHRRLHWTGSQYDEEFWQNLGEGRYYTNQDFTPKRFAMLCNMVREILHRPCEPFHVSNT